MPDLWLYVDESGQESGTFRVGALASLSPITDALTASVIAEIAARHPDARVLRDGFHAKEDKSFARSAFYRAIRAAKLDAVFVERLRHQGDGSWISEINTEVAGGTLRWHPHLPSGDGAAAHGRSLQEGLNGCLLDRFVAMDCDAIHLFMEERGAVVTSETAAAWVDAFHLGRLALAAASPLVPFRFPPVLLKVASKSDERVPGLQVCDYLLWAIQRACNKNAPGSERRRWMRQVGLTFAGAMTLGGPWAGTERRLGSGLSLPFSTPLPTELDPKAFTAPWIRMRRDEIAAIIEVASGLADQGERRLLHLRDLLRAAKANAGRRDMAPLLGAAFLLVCDTAPTYDQKDWFGYFDVCHRRAVAGRMCREGNWWSNVQHLVRFARTDGVPEV